MRETEPEGHAAESAASRIVWIVLLALLALAYLGLLGQRSGATIGTIAMIALVLLELSVWSGLLYWAFIAFFIAGGKGLPPLNDVSAIDARRQAVGVFSFALLVAILLPVPRGLYETLGVHSPYL